jgi:hypothetical protein
MQTHLPWPQSIVFGLQSIVHIIPLQSGRYSLLTHESGWQQVAGTQSSSASQYNGFPKGLVLQIPSSHTYLAPSNGSSGIQSSSVSHSSIGAVVVIVIGGMLLVKLYRPARSATITIIPIEI